MTRLQFGLNHGWRFRRGRFSRRRLRDPVDDWQSVDLPHCWNESDTFQPGVDYYRGPAIYRRTFRLPAGTAAPDSSWVLKSRGFYGTGDVWLNGRRLARIDGQYLGFTLELGEHLALRDQNELAIRLSNRCARHVLPGRDDPDFLLHGGLSGSLSVERRPLVRIEAGAVTIRPAGLDSPRPWLSIETELINLGEIERTVELGWRVVEGDRLLGETTANPVKLVAGTGKAMARARLALADTPLWTLDRPRLLTAEGVLRAGGQPVDRCSVRFGLRSAHFDESGFHLNGERVLLRGFNRHESQPGLGSALPPWLHRSDAELIKRYGGNFVRLSHYPQSPDFLDACDEMGLLVYAEIATWKSVRGGRWLRSAARQMNALIRRDRNRPSIILWGMGNESQHRRAYLALGSIIREQDPSRPSIYAENHLYRARRRGTLGLPDVWGLNYELDALPEAHQASRSSALVVTECCNQQAERGDTDGEIRQVEAMLAFWERLERHPGVAGYALWSLNDYGTMFRRRYRRFTGRFDAWRQPKLSAQLFRARHDRQPFVALLAAWGTAEPNLSRRVEIFSNCREVALYRGEELYETIEIELYARRLVEFKEAPLRLVGLHPSGAAHATLEPHGAAVGLRLRTELAALPAASRPWARIEIEVVDERGVQVPSWLGESALSVDGPARAGHFKANGRVSVANGTGRAFIRATGDLGTATVRLEAPGLLPGDCSIEFVSGEPPGRLREL